MIDQLVDKFPKSEQLLAAVTPYVSIPYSAHGIRQFAENIIQIYQRMADIKLPLPEHKIVELANLILAMPDWKKHPILGPGKFDLNKNSYSNPLHGDIINHPVYAMLWTRHDNPEVQYYYYKLQGVILGSILNGGTEHLTKSALGSAMRVIRWCSRDLASIFQILEADDKSDTLKSIFNNILYLRNSTDNQILEYLGMRALGSTTPKESLIARGQSIKTDLGYLAELLQYGYSLGEEDIISSRITTGSRKGSQSDKNSSANLVGPGHPTYEEAKLLSLHAVRVGLPIQPIPIITYITSDNEDDDEPPLADITAIELFVDDARDPNTGELPPLATLFQNAKFRARAIERQSHYLSLSLQRSQPRELVTPIKELQIVANNQINKSEQMSAMIGLISLLTGMEVGDITRLRIVENDVDLAHVKDVQYSRQYRGFWRPLIQVKRKRKGAEFSTLATIFLPDYFEIGGLFTHADKPQPLHQRASTATKNIKEILTNCPDIPSNVDRASWLSSRLWSWAAYREEGALFSANFIFGRDTGLGMTPYHYTQINLSRVIDVYRQICSRFSAELALWTPKNEPPALIFSNPDDAPWNQLPDLPVGDRKTPPLDELKEAIKIYKAKILDLLSIRQPNRDQIVAIHNYHSTWVGLLLFINTRLHVTSDN